MKIYLELTETPNVFRGIPDAEFLAAFLERVASIAAQKLPDGIPIEPPPELTKGERSLRISAFYDHPMLMSRELFAEPGGLEASLLSAATTNIGRVLQRSGMAVDNEVAIELVLIDLQGPDNFIEVDVFAAVNTGDFKSPDGPMTQ